jgi:predicted aconitase with swiveling domain
MSSYRCHKIAGGPAVAGQVLFSEDPVCFYLIDPQTGVVLEKEHCLYGQCVTGRILVFPYGKASSVVQADGMYQLQLTGKGPAGLIVQDADTTLAASAIIFGLPLVDRMAATFYQEIRDGDFLQLDAEQGQL